MSCIVLMGFNYILGDVLGLIGLDCTKNLGVGRPSLQSPSACNAKELSMIIKYTMRVCLESAYFILCSII